MFPVDLGKRSLLFYRSLVVILTFLSYVFVHAARKAISNSAPYLKEHLGYTTLFLGTMDIVFMLSYAFGMLGTGILGDVYNPVKVMFIALTLIAVNQCVFAVLLVNFTSEGFYYLYYAMWVVNGVFQSAMWPDLVRIMANYFGETNSGLIFGVWSCSAYVGNILGANISTLMIELFGNNYELVVSLTFIAPAVLCLLVGVASLLLLPESPAAARIGHLASPELSQVPSAGGQAEATDHTDQEPVKGNSTAVIVQSQPPLNFWAAWLIPNVVRYALTYACVKGVNYAMFFWLPLYLNEHAHLSSAEANTYDMLYNVGGIVGSIICGYLSDFTIAAPGGGRAPVLFAFQALSLIPICLLHTDSPSAAYLYVMLCTAGLFIGGAANIVSSATCADLGRQSALRGNRQVMGQVAGIIDGVAAVGAATVQGLVTWIAGADGEGWGGVFIMLPVCLGASCILILDLAFRETKLFLRYQCGSARQQSIETQQ